MPTGMGTARGRRVRRLVISVDVVLALAVLVTGTVYGYTRYRLHQIHRVSLGSAPAGAGTPAENGPPLVDEAPGQPFNLVLVGSDSRQFAANATDRLKFGDTSLVEGQRSDTLMVAHVDPVARTAHVMSIHRDLYVPIPGTRHSAKINSTLDKGPAALLNTLRSDLGIAASHFVQVDFSGFQKVVDAIGPVPFYFDTPVRDAYTGLSITRAGCDSLNGSDALALVRSRHLEYLQDGRWRDDATDDRGRIVRQQDFLRRVVQLVVSHGLTNPATLNKLIGSIAPSLTVDDGFGTAEMGRLGRRFGASGPSAVTWSVLPVLDDKIDGEDVERLDQPAADAMLATFGGRATGPLAANRSGPKAGAERSTPAGLASLPSDVTVRVVGSASAPAAADRARQDLETAGITATVLLDPGPPSPQVHVFAPWPLRDAAATLAGLVPGAGSTIDAGLHGRGIVMTVGATWPGFTGQSSAVASTVVAPSTTTTTVPVKGTNDKVSCP